MCTSHFTGLHHVDPALLGKVAYFVLLALSPIDLRYLVPLELQVL
jgi:hypothetical protein